MFAEMYVVSVTAACVSDQFTCYYNTCIPLTAVNNTYPDCDDGSDEGGSISRRYTVSMIREINIV